MRKIALNLDYIMPFGVFIQPQNHAKRRENKNDVRYQMWRQ